MEGYIASIFIGIALGLIGGGGSILTVPVLVYLFNINAVLATAYSLFIVGATSVVGSFSSFKKGLVNINCGASGCNTPIRNNNNTSVENVSYEEVH